MSKKLPVNGEFNSDLLVALFIFLKGRAGPSTYLLPFAFMYLRRKKVKNTKARLRLSETEVAILKAILPGRQFSFTLIYLAAQDLYQSKLPPPKFFHQILKRMVNKGILYSEIDIKSKEPVYNLTSYGQILREYTHPFFMDSNKDIVILVTSETASRELGLSRKALRNKHVKFLHYFVLDKKLYIFKKTKIDELIYEIPAFPLISSLIELYKVFPDPPKSIYPLLMKLLQDNGRWFWPDLLSHLRMRGKEIHPEDNKVKNKTKHKTKEGCHEGRKKLTRSDYLESTRATCAAPN